MNTATREDPALMESQKPFSEAFRQLADALGLGQREIARRCQQHHGWGTPGSINQLMAGTLAPSVMAMEEISRVLQIPPETFAEYRLARAREQLDPGKVGLKSALDNLARSGLTAQGADAEPEPHSPEDSVPQVGRAGRAALP